MAEVLGLVASGLSVAQIAGSIVITSLKVKALLDEVKDAPEGLRNMLDHIELLAPILCEATAGGDEGAGTNLALLPATSHLQQAMQRALAACQAAGEQLELLARSLMSQIEAARGGVRRKRAAVKIVLKRGTLAQYETRLQRTVQLLSLAQSTYMIALQQSQPETIVSQLMSALALSRRSAHDPTMIPHDGSPTQINRPLTVTERRTSTHQNASAFHECWQLGLAKVTGLVRIHTPPRDKDCQTTSSAQDRVLRIQVQMPTWLCASVFDVVFSRSYAGWDCSLNVYGRLREGSMEFDHVTDAIIDDDVEAIHHLFQERRCGPRDLLVWHEDGEESLLSYAVGAGAWQASVYLLNYAKKVHLTSQPCSNTI
ncbi:hypothetical protein INS49_010620 [Diaporthe citri]|uniref:uncharacterized protein n=1 Tax=Diaporthe citri TaxID=83186 RepID=UPI001C7FEDEE|nr:uncharacterized protein INS49_010620 [Diaporthe citri]KAG6362390.1 hypothetical protein INS49_010620 [Diaporthe citri]